MSRQEEIKKKFELLKELLSDPDITENEEFKSLLSAHFKVEGNNNVFAILGNASQIVHHHYEKGPKHTLPTELSTEELKKIRDFVDRIVKLELQAKNFRIASPQGISFTYNLRSAYAAVWKRFNDHFNLNEYKALPKKNYKKAILFLKNWETSLLNKLVRKTFEIDIDRNYLLGRIFGIIKSKNKTKEDLENYSIRKFGIPLKEATTGELWLIYRNYATRPKKKK